MLWSAMLSYRVQRSPGDNDPALITGCATGDVDGLVPGCLSIREGIIHAERVSAFVAKPAQVGCRRKGPATTASGDTIR